MVILSVWCLPMKNHILIPIDAGELFLDKRHSLSDELYKKIKMLMLKLYWQSSKPEPELCLINIQTRQSKAGQGKAGQGTDS